MLIRNSFFMFFVSDSNYLCHVRMQVRTASEQLCARLSAFAAVELFFYMYVFDPNLVTESARLKCPRILVLLFRNLLEIDRSFAIISAASPENIATKVILTSRG